MKANQHLKSFIYLHIAVFLWGFTAILGKLISYGSLNLVWHRMLITSLVYLCMPAVIRELKTITFKTFLLFASIGLIVCAHWLTFYGSIKLGNSVSITLACLGTTSFFASIIEPFALRKKYSLKDSMIGLIVLIGVIFISISLPEPQAKNISYKAAIVVGVISAALAATFTTLNKKHIHKAHPIGISAIEMISGATILSAIIPFTQSNPIWFPKFDPSSFDPNNLQNGALDLVWVLILAILCTNLTFYLGTFALKQLSAFTANLTVNLEPIYGIILGVFIFHENQDLNAQFYIGTIIIILAIFANPIISFFNHESQ